MCDHVIMLLEMRKFLPDNRNDGKRFNVAFVQTNSNGNCIRADNSPDSKRPQSFPTFSGEQAMRDHDVNLKGSRFYEFFARRYQRCAGIKNVIDDHRLRTHFADRADMNDAFPVRCFSK